MRSKAPEIVKTAERLMFDLEQAVCAFPRKHRYQLGADLRANAIAAALLTRQACLSARNKARQSGLLQQLSDRIDMLKLCLQLGQQLQAFSSFGRFRDLAILARSMGKQCGALQRSVEQHLNGQNPPASAPAESPETLSSRAASAEAHP